MAHLRQRESVGAVTGIYRMSRLPIDFLQTQSLPWQPSPWANLSGCQIKGLSHDATNAARSLLVRFPAYWPGPADSLATEEEMLVLEGSLDLDGHREERDAYHASPPGAARDLRAGPNGAVALVFWSSESYGSAPERPGGATATHFQDAFEMAWAPVPAEATPFGRHVSSKALRGSLADSTATMLLTVPPHVHPERWTGPQAIASCALELFVLSGDLLAPVGQLGAGAYCWCPPGSAHGPFGSRGGALLLMRTAHGPYRISPSSHEMTLEREPNYQPNIPPEFQWLVAHPWRVQSY